MDHLNAYNRLFYSCFSGAFTDFGLANFFISLTPLQNALIRKIYRGVGKNDIRLIELSAGKRLDRWEILSKENIRGVWSVILTDFSKEALPDRIPFNLPPNISISTDIINVLQPIRYKKPADAVLITYGFDSVWLPQDRTYRKKKGEWFLVQYTIEVNQRFLHRKRLLNTLQNMDHTEITAEDFDNLTIKTHEVPVDITTEPWGIEIRTYYHDEVDIYCNFPGGLIAKTKELFKGCLSEGGVLVCGDIAANGPHSAAYPMTQSIQRSGKYALFKVEEYGLAKSILNENGFQAELLTVNELLAEGNEEIPLDLADHLVLTVKKQL